VVVWILTLLKGPTQPPATVGELEMLLLVGDLVGDDEVAVLCTNATILITTAKVNNLCCLNRHHVLQSYLRGLLAW
jgi:hypothetical protein